MRLAVKVVKHNSLHNYDNKGIELVILPDGIPAFVKLAFPF